MPELNHPADREEVAALRDRRGHRFPTGPGGQSLVAVGTDHIRGVLGRTGWVIEGPNGAAKALGLHPNTLRSRMKKLGIVRPS